MPFPHNYTGIDELGGFTPIPAGKKYTFRIEETKDGITKRGHYKSDVKLTVAESPSGDYIGRTVFHTVSFLPKGEAGAGISKHWLKCLGQPYEGEVMVDSRDWIGSFIVSDVGIDTYKGKDKNVLEDIYVPEGLEEELEDTATSEEQPEEQPNSKEDVPF